MIVLDGRQGGGQMLRTALALSTITQQPFRMTNIRATRGNSGLAPQHLTCVKALKILCDAKTEGDEIGSQELLFIPGPFKAKNHTIDIGTAGSITLLLQSLLLPSLFAPKPFTLKIIGGTDVNHSVPIDSFSNTILPYYKLAGGIEIRLIKRGYYPRGGGEIEIKFTPEIKRNNFNNFNDFLKIVSHKGFELTRKGTLAAVKGISNASASLSARKVAERTASSAQHALSSLNIPINISAEYRETPSTGSGISVWTIFENDIEPKPRISADVLGEMTQTSEQIGVKVAKLLLERLQNEAPIDEHIADNLIPLIGILRPSKIKIPHLTDHIMTNMEVCKAFLGDVYVQEERVIRTNSPI